MSTSHHQLITLDNHWSANHEISLIFHLADQPQHVGVDPNAVLANKQNCLVGLQTHWNGQVHFQGRYHTFLIQFKATALTALFRVPASELTNKIITGEDLVGPPINTLQEQLQHADTVQQMAMAADSFLLSRLSATPNRVIRYDGITTLANQLSTTTQWLRVDQYADICNMSVRNFERRFTEQLGIAPKLYLRLVRFSEVVNAKRRHPAKSLTRIAHEYGYYDQMHLIKDCKQFTSLSPTAFFGQTAELVEQPVARATTGFVSWAIE